MADSIRFTLGIGCTEVCGQLCHQDSGLAAEPLALGMGKATGAQGSVLAGYRVGVVLV